MEFKYTKLLIIALLSAGILTFAYGGCSTSSDDEQQTSEDTGDQPGGMEQTPEQPEDMGGTVDPPADMGGGDMGDTSCQGDAFPDTTATATVRQIECLTDFFIQTGEESMIECICDSPETGPFILDIGPSFGGDNNIVFQFPSEEVFFFNWDPIDCSSMNITSGGFFEDDPLVQVGTITNFAESSPDNLGFTVNITDAVTSDSFGTAAATATCDFCSLDELPVCAPGL